MPAETVFMLPRATGRRDVIFFLEATGPAEVPALQPHPPLLLKNALTPIPQRWQPAPQRVFASLLPFRPFVL